MFYIWSNLMSDKKRGTMKFLSLPQLKRCQTLLKTVHSYFIICILKYYIFIGQKFLVLLASSLCLPNYVACKISWFLLCTILFFSLRHIVLFLFKANTVKHLQRLDWDRAQDLNPVLSVISVNPAHNVTNKPVSYKKVFLIQ